MKQKKTIKETKNIPCHARERRLSYEYIHLKKRMCETMTYKHKPVGKKLTLTLIQINIKEICLFLRSHTLWDSHFYMQAQNQSFD